MSTISSLFFSSRVMMITKLNATYLCIQRCQKLGKRRFVFIETLDHCVEHGFRLELVYIITMAGIFCEERKNDELCAAVSFPERMDGIEFREEMRAGSVCFNNSMGDCQDDPARITIEGMEF